MDDKHSIDHHLTAPTIERIRHELRRRSLTVESISDITPGMRRIVLRGEDLADFISLPPDDHIKIIVSGIDGAEERRDYTPSRYDNAARRLTIDFALHEAGPATLWAIAAQPGAPLEIGGPRGSAVVSGVKRWLLIGDETALPAIGRRIEESGADTDITTIAAVADKNEEQFFETIAALRTHWVHRPLPEATNAEPLIAALTGIDIVPQTFVWIAAEASVVRAIRAYLVEDRGYPLSWIKASGYWVKGKPDATEKFE
ncbi:siderophore-interacting protein [Rhizobium sp. BK650]|uniref:siderophore-interacting protein n=1 Tax=Rhizobium sp. BK650 TaxID=2586990 RepID=UPI00160C2B50|nr:siderophore-interacting protein [Rhizobium sp. BK650]